MYFFASLSSFSCSSFFYFPPFLMCACIFHLLLHHHRTPIYISGYFPSTHACFTHMCISILYYIYACVRNTYISADMCVFVNVCVPDIDSHTRIYITKIHTHVGSYFPYKVDRFSFFFVFEFYALISLKTLIRNIYFLPKIFQVNNCISSKIFYMLSI